VAVRTLVARPGVRRRTPAQGTESPQ
jgi:hypothetical protein